VNTKELMAIALDMAKYKETPPDSGIHVPGGEGIRKVLFGLDVTVGDLVLARHLGCDCVIAHHYEGTPSRVNAWKQYLKHIDQMVSFGVPRKEAEEAVYPRAKGLEVQFHMDNYDQVSSAARLLEMPFLNIHSPLDEIGRRLMQERVDDALSRDSSATVGDLADALATMSTFDSAKTKVTIRVGDPGAPAGRTVVSHAALRNGGAPVALAYYKHGISTVIYIHIAPADYVELAKARAGNLIIAGHIAADTLGILPYVEELRTRGLEVIATGGVLT
jgi:hypothetical protein